MKIAYLRQSKHFSFIKKQFLSKTDEREQNKKRLTTTTTFHNFCSVII